jgi:threonine synthase
MEADADVVVILTGNQLKDTKYILERHADAQRSGRWLQLEPTRDALRRALEPWLSLEVARPAL